MSRLCRTPTPVAPPTTTTRDHPHPGLLVLIMGLLLGSFTGLVGAVTASRMGGGKSGEAYLAGGSLPCHRPAHATYAPRGAFRYKDSYMKNSSTGFGP